MFGTTLQRVIMKELMRIWALTLLGLTVLFLLGGLVAEASNRGLAPAQILTLMPLMVPSTLPYTIPTTTLFAVCNVYGRMAKDNEITALRASGINLWSIMKPCVLMGLFSTVLTMSMFYDVIPGSNRSMREHLLSDINELLTTLIKRQGSIQHPHIPYVVFAREVHGDRLVDVIFKRRIPETLRYDTVARAREARFRVETRVDPSTGLTANYILMDMTQCVVCNFSTDQTRPDVVQFQSREFAEKLPAGMFGSKDQPRSADVGWPDLLKRTEHLRTRELARAAEIEALATRVKSTPNPTPQDVHDLARLTGAQRGSMREYRSFESEKHLRPALAFGCLCFALIGAPIGIWASRADFLSTFVIGFLPVVGLYYPIMISLTNAAKDGKIPIPLAMWTADAIFLIVACLLCRRLIRR